MIHLTLIHGHALIYDNRPLSTTPYQIKLISNSTLILLFFDSIVESNESTINMSELDKQKIIEKLRQSMEVSSTLFTSGQVTMSFSFT
jgi:hypothetical protein